MSAPDSLEDLAAELDTIRENFGAVFSQLSDLREENEELRNRLDAVEEENKLLRAAANKQFLSPYERARQILAFAEQRSHTDAGTWVTTHEARAAANCSGESARKTFHDLGAAFDWARHEPGRGGEPSKLRIHLHDADIDTRIDELTDHYAEHGRFRA